MATRDIEIRAFDGLLYQGEAEFSPLDDAYYGWQLHILVPNYVAAQYMMRKDDRVVVEVEDDDVTVPAYVGGFELLPDAESSGMGGHARIQLRGRGAVPVKERAAEAAL